MSQVSPQRTNKRVESNPSSSPFRPFLLPSPRSSTALISERAEATAAAAVHSTYCRKALWRRIEVRSPFTAVVFWDNRGRVARDGNTHVFGKDLSRPNILFKKNTHTQKTTLLGIFWRIFPSWKNRALKNNRTPVTRKPKRSPQQELFLFTSLRDIFVG